MLWVEIIRKTGGFSTPNLIQSCHLAHLDYGKGYPAASPTSIVIPADSNLTPRSQ